MQRFLSLFTSTCYHNSLLIPNRAINPSMDENVTLKDDGDCMSLGTCATCVYIYAYIYLFSLCTSDKKMKHGAVSLTSVCPSVCPSIHDRRGPPESKCPSRTYEASEQDLGKKHCTSTGMARAHSKVHSLVCQC